MSDNLVANTMSDAEIKEKKSEGMKSYAWIQTVDGSMHEMEHEIAMLCPPILHEMKSGLGSSKNNPISLPPKVKPTYLRLVIEYCRFHLGCRSYQEHKTFDENFLQMEVRSLYELLYLANYLQLGRLLNSTKEAMAQQISNKSAEEIWHMLKSTDNLPEAETSKSQEYSNSDLRMRLRKKIYSNMTMSAVDAVKKLKDCLTGVTGVKPRQHEDTREVDDLVSFINGDDEDTKAVQTLKKKKKKNHNKGKGKKKASSSSALSSPEAPALKKVIENHEDMCASESANHSGPTAADSLQDESFNVEGDTVDHDLDPVKMEEIDREVLKFAWLLNLDPDTIH